MAGKKLLGMAIAALLLANTGCCRWCDRWCGNRQATPVCCTPAPVCCPPAPVCCPPAPVCQPVHSSPVSGGPQWQRNP